jgi:hypothetical protein
MKRIITSLFLLVALIIASSLATIHAVQETSGRAQLLWRGGDAYLFVSTQRWGWRESYVRFLFGIFMSVAQYGDAPQDVTRPAEMFKITAEGVERVVLNDIDMVWPRYTVFEGQIYDGRASRLVGMRFQPTTPDEQRRYSEARVTKNEYSNVAGWSNRYLLKDTPPEGTKVSVDLAGQSVVFTIVSTAQARSISVQRAGRPAERLWSIDERVRFVGETEYKAFLSSRR